MGYTSRQGNEFNVLTIRHILKNPKYKGWYCGNKTRSLDYRTKKRAFLDESEWIMYPDPSIPPIVSEELWDRANALYKRRSEQMLRHQSRAEFHNRYPYSGKIICQTHGTSFHRQVLKSAKGEKEVWQCRVYRQRGRAACSSPQLGTWELDGLMAQIFTRLVQNKQAIIDTLVSIIVHLPHEYDCTHSIKRLEEEIDQLNAKKDRLLEISTAGGLTISEFKKRNDGFNRQLAALENKLELVRQEQEKNQNATVPPEQLRAALQKELDFTDGIDSNLVTTILDHIIVNQNSTKEEVHVEIFLKCGGPCKAVFQRSKTSFCISC
jgi:site-specific DNA recombinase